MSLYGWIVYNGFLQDNKFRDFAEMLQSSALKQGHTIKLMSNDSIINNINKEQFTNINEPLPHYVLFTDKDIYLASMLERVGIRLFNEKEAIELSDDKIKTYLTLSNHGIPIPETIVAPKTFGISMDDDEPFIEHVVNKLQYPFILKEAFGSFGEQVYLVRDESELSYYLHKIAGNPFVFQQYIRTSHGVDLRLQVVGNEVVAAMKRKSVNDFRANVTTGGSMKPYEPNQFERQLAIEATKAIGADFAGVDLLIGENDQRYVCEVNSNAHIRNLYDCTGINVAPAIIKYVEQNIK